MPDIEALAGFKLIILIFIELIIGVTGGLLLTIFFAASNLAGEKNSSKYRSCFLLGY